MRDADWFFDTSVLLYVLSGEIEKAERVEGLLTRAGTISVQVLNEFAAVATRKLGLSLVEVREVLGVIRAVCVTHPLTIDHHDKGIEIAERYRVSFFDSLIIASALLAGCTTLYSEDLQHRQIIEGRLKVINPFLR
jgi:predicted nucleic acid-binding protein